ncbi:hypothetical protein AB836_00425 [Rickettsiales bacterium (ex Bugula neritina AB1)]|nr:hypothetical protein AB836_00425 [Rickettsiales bacterium (ex Bugula neritina AB1)]
MYKTYDINSIKSLFPKCDFSYLNDEFLQIILEKIKGRFVGGIVRDSLLGIDNKDIDIATPFIPEKVMDILKDYKPIPTGIVYGTVSIFYKKYRIEITSLRKDVENYGRKSKVVFQGDWKSDSDRRDFTFNSLFYIKNIIYDYQNGIEDLKNGIVRFIGDAYIRIQEDYLRILRFIRFFIRYSKINNYEFYKDLLLKLVKNIKILSIERVLMEIKSILKHFNWKKGITIINELGISKLLWEKDLNLEKYEFNEKERLYIIFYKYPYHQINKMPFLKEEKKFLMYFIKIYNNNDINTYVNIWKKIQSFPLLKEMLLLKDKINDNDIYKDIILVEEKDFITYKNDYIFIHKEGIKRGFEEDDCKENFLKLYIK